MGLQRMRTYTVEAAREEVGGARKAPGAAAGGERHRLATGGSPPAVHLGEALGSISQEPHAGPRAAMKN